MLLWKYIDKILSFSLIYTNNHSYTFHFDFFDKNFIEKLRLISSVEILIVDSPSVQVRVLSKFSLLINRAIPEVLCCAKTSKTKRNGS